MKSLMISAAVAALAFTWNGAASADSPAAYIQNYSYETIWEVNVSPSHFEDWGDDVLYEYTIPAGSAMTVFPYYLDGCYYDIRVIFEDEEVLKLWKVDLCNEPYLSIGNNEYHSVSW